MNWNTEIRLSDLLANYLVLDHACFENLAFFRRNIVSSEKTKTLGCDSLCLGVSYYTKEETSGNFAGISMFTH